MMRWTLKCMSRPPKNTLDFRWIPGCHIPGRETGAPPTPPNIQTKEKMRKLNLQKAGRRISLFRTAGRPRQMRNSHWSPRPEARCQTHYPERRTPSPDKKQPAVQDPRPSQFAQALMTKKIERGDWSDDSSTDSTPETMYHEQSKMAGKIHSTALSPESPPEYEKGLSNLDYVPKSPIYYPPDMYSDVSDHDSLINLIDEDF